MRDNQDYFNVNASTWNKKVAIHAKSEMYNMEEFKLGKSSLNRYELDALGDVNNKSLLHLQCHFGQDTLSLARMGANCTGVDISEKGIELAQNLNKSLQQDAKFVCCNVLDTSKYIDKTFDIVYTSYGVIGWLPNLKPWAKMIAERLKPGGVFYMVEFHPIVWMFDYTSDDINMRYGYHQNEVIHEEYKGTYADETSEIISKEYTWNHGLGEVVTALIEAGLTIEYLHEHNESPYDVLPDLQATSTGHYTTKHQLYPLIFELKAYK